MFMLESIVCGILVLVISVGAIPDIIKDRETGVIIENNSQECIVNNIERAINYPNQYHLINNVKELVEEDFTYKEALKDYKKILDNLLESLK